MRKTFIATLIVLTTLFVGGCVNTPPALSPQATLAFNQTQIEKALDLIRDTAETGATLNPPVFTLASARAVTQWHEAAIKVLYADQSGWQVILSTGLTQLLIVLPPNEAAQIQPYVQLAQALIAQVVN